MKVQEPPLANRLAVMDIAAFRARRKFAKTPQGRIAYVEQGQGPPMVFLHGVPLNGFHWRHIMAALGDMRRCIALDLMALGYTEVAPGQDLSFTGQAAMLASFIDALGLDRIDLVGNDSGGAVAQIFAANHPQRLRTLTLTNCDAHDNWPPTPILPLIEGARAGKLADQYKQLPGNLDNARTRFSRTYADPSFLTDELVRFYIEPFLATPERIENFHRYWIAFNPAQTLAIESRLRTLRVPTLIVWGLEDIFFDVKWGQWLRDTIPGAVDLIKVPRGKLFFAEDMPDALIQPLRAFLSTRG